MTAFFKSFKVTTPSRISPFSSSLRRMVPRRSPRAFPLVDQHIAQVPSRVPTVVWTGNESIPELERGVIHSSSPVSSFSVSTAMLAMEVSITSLSSLYRITSKGVSGLAVAVKGPSPTYRTNATELSLFCPYQRGKISSFYLHASWPGCTLLARLSCDAGTRCPWVSLLCRARQRWDHLKRNRSGRIQVEFME